jgi:hypothetical protein
MAHSEHKAMDLNFSIYDLELMVFYVHVFFILVL